MSKLKLDFRGGGGGIKPGNPKPTVLLELPKLNKRPPLNNRYPNANGGGQYRKHTNYVTDERLLLKRARALVATKNGYRWLPKKTLSTESHNLTVAEPNVILSDSASSTSSTKDEYDDDDVFVVGTFLENHRNQPATKTSKTSSSSYSIRDDLSSPRIRLKLLDVKKLNRTGVGNCDPRDENTLRELENHVHASMIKHYDVIIPKKIELPVFNANVISLAARRDHNLKDLVYERVEKDDNEDDNYDEFRSDDLPSKIENVRYDKLPLINNSGIFTLDIVLSHLYCSRIVKLYYTDLLEIYIYQLFIDQILS